MTFGRLERGNAPQPLSEINVTPLVDVMLVLVVVLIVTAPLLATRLRLDLPRSEAASTQASQEVVTLAVDAQGQLYWGEAPVTADVMGVRLQEVARLNPQTELQLRADATVPYGRVVEVLGWAQKAGLHRIGFVADPAPAR